MEMMGSSLLQDLRFALRLFNRNKSFTGIAVLTLALGIGANTAIFSIVNSILLKPLPYEKPMELVMLWSDLQKMGAPRAPASPALLKEIRERSQTLQGVAGIRVGNNTFVGEPEPEQVKVGFVTANFFSVLAVKPALGRLFQPEDEQLQPGGTRAIVLSHGIWQRRFGGDPNIIGRAVRLGANSSFTVAGVLPADFRLVFPPDSDIPLEAQAYTAYPKAIYNDKNSQYLRLIGRIKPGVTIEQVKKDASAIAEQFSNQYPEYKAENLQLRVIGLHADVVRDINLALLALLFGAGLVLLISCFNVANLLLTRATVRRKEIAVRAALGASRWRMTQQLLSESLLLCFLAAVLGLGVGWAGLKLLLSIRPESLARVGTIGLDLTTLVFVSAISLGAGLLAGLAPVLETGKVNLVESLKQEGRTLASRGGNRIRLFLTVSEIALGFVLLVGAGLMIRTLIQLQRTSPGFDPNQVLTFEMSIPFGPNSYRTPQDLMAFLTQFEAKISALPGVQAVGAVSHLPLDDYPNWYDAYAPEGKIVEETSKLLADHRATMPGYFQAMGARLLGGRYFNNMDLVAGSANIVIVDDVVARQNWPHETAVGKKINIQPFSGPRTWFEIVGVVENLKSHGLFASLRGQIYIPYQQSIREHLSYAVRASGDPMALAAAIRRELNSLNKNMAIAKIRPLQQYVDKAMAPTKFTATLAGIFALLALLLAAVGIYGVVSYSVSQRTQEIGVRMALGARPTDILKLVMKEGLILTAFGLPIGFIASLALSRYLQTMLFGVTSLDPMTYIVIAIVIPMTTLFACWRPAQKAAAGSAMDALRQS